MARKRSVSYASLVDVANNVRNRSGGQRLKRVYLNYCNHKDFGPEALIKDALRSLYDTGNAFKIRLGKESLINCWEEFYWHFKTRKIKKDEGEEIDEKTEMEFKEESKKIANVFLGGVESYFHDVDPDVKKYAKTKYHKIHNTEEREKKSVRVGKLEDFPVFHKTYQLFWQKQIAEGSEQNKKNLKNMLGVHNVEMLIKGYQNQS